jgi:hypothetical protein
MAGKLADGGPPPPPQYLCIEYDGTVFKVVCKKLPPDLTDSYREFTFPKKLVIRAILSGFYRQTLYTNMSPSLSVFGEMAELPAEIHEWLRACVCNSTVILLCPDDVALTEATPIVALFVEFQPGQDIIVGDGYITTLARIKQTILTLMINSRMLRGQPDLTGSYNYGEQIVAIFLNLGDLCTQQVQGDSFDFEIRGRATTGVDFHKTFKIDPDCHEFLDQLAKVCDIYFTGKELHEARAITWEASSLNWRPKGAPKKPEVLGDELIRTFSHYSDTPMKVPDLFSENGLPFLVVDGTPERWDVLPDGRNFPIISPRPNLLSVAKQIKIIVKEYYDKLFSNMRGLMSAGAAALPPNIIDLLKSVNMFEIIDTVVGNS